MRLCAVCSVGLDAMTIRFLVSRVLRVVPHPIRSLALRVLKGLARPIVVRMPPVVQVRAQRAWTRLKGPTTPEVVAVLEAETPLPELTLAAARVWQDLIEARAMAGRQPLGGSAQQEGPRADPA
jgi:hypothetical protein